MCLCHLRFVRQQPCDNVGGGVNFLENNYFGSPHISLSLLEDNIHGTFFFYSGVIRISACSDKTPNAAKCFIFVIASAKECNFTVLCYTVNWEGG